MVTFFMKFVFLVSSVIWKKEPPEYESDNSDIEDDMSESESDTDSDDDGYEGPENGQLYRDYLANRYF
jgi:hypothetical protein